MTDDLEMKNKAAISLVGLALSLFLATPAPGQPLGDGIAAFAVRDYARARSIFRDLAEDGNAEAAFRLGWMFESGHGVAADAEAAIRWYRRAVEAGHAAARERLSRLTAPKDAEEPEALAEMRSAAEEGSVHAMIRLGKLYALGESVPLDPAAARRWFERAVAVAPEGYLADYAQNALAILENNAPADSETANAAAPPEGR